MTKDRWPTRALLAAALVVALPFLAAAQSGPPASPVGPWLTEGGDAVIDIEPCGAALCGRIVGIQLDHMDDPIPRDWRGRSQCGVAIIRDMRPSDDGAWHGQIIDPRDGATYRGTLRVDGAGQLRLRGYILLPLLGKTQIWTRYAGPRARDCRMPNLPVMSNHR